MIQTNVSSKSILAKLLAAEDITVIHGADAPTASFDVKSRVLTLPCWTNMSNSLYDMLVGHEVSHALYTPNSDSDGWFQIEALAKSLDMPASTVKLYANVVEDARIERMIKAKFPGLRRDFIDSYQDLMERDLFGIAGTDINTLPLIDRLNLEFKCGIHAGLEVPFTTEERTLWVDRMAATKTWSDVMDLVRDLLESEGVQNEEQEQQQPEQGTDGPQGDDEQEQDQDEDGPSEGREIPADEAGDEEQDSPESESGTGEDSSDESGDEDQPSDETGTKSASMDAPKPMTNEKLEENIAKDHQEEYSSYNQPETVLLPTCDLDHVIVTGKEIYSMLYTQCANNDHWAGFAQEAREFITQSRSVVNILAKRFEMKKAADAHKRTMTAKTGTLDTVKMMNYKWSEDVFRKNTIVREGKNHGLVMFIDWSGSMAECFRETMEQLVQLVLFCKKVNIPFEVYGFSSAAADTFRGADRHATGKKCWDDAKENGYGGFSGVFSQFSLLNIFSSKMNKREFDAALIGAMYLGSATRNYDAPVPGALRLGGTPLDEAIAAGLQIIPAFQTANNVQIVNTIFLTDGVSNSCRIDRNDSILVKGRRIVKRVEKRSSTTALTELLREVTGTRTIGMFLEPSNKLRNSNSYFTGNRYNYPSWEELADLQDEFKTNGFLTANNKHGNDEQFIIKANKKVSNKTGLDKLPDDASLTRIKNAFIKGSSQKMASRLMLNQFIDIIA